MHASRVIVRNNDVLLCRTCEHDETGWQGSSDHKAVPLLPSAPEDKACLSGYQAISIHRTEAVFHTFRLEETLSVHNENKLRNLGNLKEYCPSEVERHSCFV